MINSQRKFPPRIDLPGPRISLGRRLVRLLLFLSIVLGCSLLTAWICHRHYTRQCIQVSNNNSSSPFQFVHQHRGQKDAPTIFQSQGPLNSCPMLYDCFPGDDSTFRNLASCQENMDYLGKYYDNTIALKDGKVVGFISCHVEYDPDNKNQVAFNIYNVCVDRKVRGQGLAKLLLEETVRATINYHKLQDKRVLLALDVDFTTEMAAEAFALYAKLGFLRAWQPCRSVADVDWRPIFNEPNSLAVQSPLPRILAEPTKYLNDEMKGERPSLRLRSRTRSTGPIFTHFCMFKFYDESFLTMGRTLKSGVSPQ